MTMAYEQVLGDSMSDSDEKEHLEYCTTCHQPFSWDRTGAIYSTRVNQRLVGSVAPQTIWPPTVMPPSAETARAWNITLKTVISQ